MDRCCDMILWYDVICYFLSSKWEHGERELRLCYGILI